MTAVGSLPLQPAVPPIRLPAPARQNPLHLKFLAIAAGLYWRLLAVQLTQPVWGRFVNPRWQAIAAGSLSQPLVAQPDLEKTIFKLWGASFPPTFFLYVMNLTLDNTIHFLLRRNLISRKSVIGGDFEVTSAKRRNTNFQVTTSQEGNLLLKVPRADVHEGLDSSLREIQMYEFARTATGRESIGRFLPRLLDSDVQIPMLAIEFYPKGLPVWRYYKACGAAQFPWQTVAKIGELLADFHCEGRQLITKKPQELSFLSEKLPYPFDLHRPGLDLLERLSGGSFRLIEVLQSEPVVLEAIELAISNWQINGLVHGDIKMDNFVLPRVNAEVNPSDEEVVLVDWEMAQWGDVAWDIAGAFQDFVFWWVLSMPEAGRMEDDAAQAGFPVPYMRKAMQTFWNSYRKHLDFEEEDLLERAMRLTACRLVQTSYEIASKFDFFPRNASLLLNVAMGVLKDPARGKVELFGFETQSTSV